ncbi:hypothetical protein D1007_46612 [Hordeum vulgare]|nr:hypothetical protein D1007_46612 [Hordeum vulgare]
MYSTLVDTLVDHVIDATTHALSTRTCEYFLANHAARYMMLNTQYRNLGKGGLSVDEYARSMKLLTVGLADIKHAVTKINLTTQFLHGLDQHLDTIHIVLGDIIPVPPF